MNSGSAAPPPGNAYIGPGGRPGSSTGTAIVPPPPPSYQGQIERTNPNGGLMRPPTPAYTVPLPNAPSNMPTPPAPVPQKKNPFPPPPGPGGVQPGGPVPPPPPGIR